MGARQETTLAMIKRRFPEAEDAVERAFLASDSFRGLCRDYLACVATLAHWQDSVDLDAPHRVLEYSELLGELTKEIEAGLRADEDGPRRNG